MKDVQLAGFLDALKDFYEPINKMWGCEKRGVINM